MTTTKQDANLQQWSLHVWDSLNILVEYLLQATLLNFVLKGYVRDQLCAWNFHYELASTTQVPQSLWTYKVVSNTFQTDAVKIVKLIIRPISPYHPRSSSLPYVDTGSTAPPFLEHFLKSFSIRMSSTLRDSACISSMVSNRRPFSCNFISGTRNKSQGAKSGEYGGWGITAILFFSSVQFSSDVDTLLLLVSCQDPGHKFGCDTMHAQFFRQNLLACLITNSHLLSNVVNGPDRWILEFVQQFQDLCSLWVSLCVHHCQLMCNWSWTGHPIETPAHNSSFGPWRLVESLWGSPWHFSQDLHKIWCTLTVPFSDPSWKSPQVTYTTPNKRVWKLPTSTQLHANWYTDSLDIVVLPSTGALCYHNCCIDGGTSLENFGYHLILEDKKWQETG